MIGRLKITSPGLLLIAAVAAAGGIFLLDLLYFGPNVESQKDAALLEQASRTAQMGRLAIQNEQANLRSACFTWARRLDLARLDDESGSGEAFAELARELAGESQVDAAWVSTPGSQLTAAWIHTDWVGASRDADTVAMEIKNQLASLGNDEDLPGEMLLKLGNHVVIVARHALGNYADTSEARDWLWLARRLDATVLERIGLAIGGDVVLVGASDIPRGTFKGDSATHALWPSGSDTLAVAWRADDPTGQTLSCFRADISVIHVNLQAAGARRTMLIVLSLSVGLVLLVILGVHVLVSGPVLRLLKRLQAFETNEPEHGELAKDLHGEPLVLARRLESAFDKLAHMSKTDELTGLANRRHFEEVLDCFYSQAKRYSRPLSLIVMDLDFFKAINDTGGHSAGDEILLIAAEAIEKACRKADLPARLGGDEFAVLLPETSVADAVAVADRIHESVAAAEFSVRDIKTSITVSIGVTDLNSGEIDSPEAMQSMADRALYAAKEAGRNRIVQAHELDGVTWSDSSPHGGRVSTLCKKLAGLDSQFKVLFLTAIEEIMEILEQRDPHMADHARKVQKYAILIAEEMELPERIIKRIEIAAMLHDIGMLAMPDSVLLCPTELDDEMLAIMRKHPLYSVRIMEGMEFLEQEIPAVRYHHERYDGQGYPEGLAGAAIPLTARVLAAADVFDAMTSPRTFRQSKSRTEAIIELQSVAGAQLDPIVVDALASLSKRLGDELMAPPAPKEGRQTLAETLDAPQPDALKSQAATVAAHT